MSQVVSQMPASNPDLSQRMKRSILRAPEFGAGESARYNQHIRCDLDKAFG